MYLKSKYILVKATVAVGGQWQVTHMAIIPKNSSWHPQIIQTY